MGEEQGRPAGGDNAAVDLGDLQVRIDRCVHLHYFAFFFESIQKIA